MTYRAHATCWMFLLCNALAAWQVQAVSAADATAQASADRIFAHQIRPLVERLCIDCHGDAEFGEAGLDLNRFADAGSVRADRALWKRVAEQIETHAMPPRDSDQPTTAERQQLLTWIREIFAEPGPTGHLEPGRPVIRRLTRLEYNNTLRDLFGLDLDVFVFPERLPIDWTHYDPTAEDMAGPLKVRVREFGSKVRVLVPQGGLASDGRAEHGFSNRGDVMNTSPALLEAYVALAGQIVESPGLAESPAFQQLIADPQGDPAEVARRRLEAFLPKVFRRPVDAAELSRYVAVFAAGQASGRSFADSMRLAVQAALASPSFLYLESRFAEAEPAAVAPIDDFALANRLSYFLWSSMPDEELFALARQKRLHDPAVLRSQVERMLRDPRSRALVECFAVEWLRLDQLYTAKPDRKLFRTFYAGPQGKSTLHGSLLAEPLLLFEMVLIEDQSVLNFLASDTTWLNERLAKHYELEDQLPPLADGEKERDGDLWYRVKLPNQRRGGVLTTGAVLSLTSLPQRTSPVKRGAWILEAIFNRPPNEPRVPVPPLDEEGAEATATTLRERLEQHRANATCAACHDRIDPPGFALENFDPIGGWRMHDGTGPIDASSAWTDGGSFAGPEEFKASLLDRSDQFTTAFVEHLLAYSLGRELAWHDTPVVHNIVRQARENDHRFSSIILGIVTSEPFLLASQASNAKH